MANTNASASDEFEDYISVLTSLLRESETVTDRVEIRVGRETVTAQRVSYEIDDADFIGLLEDWLDIFEADESIMNAFNVAGMETGMDHRAMVRNMRSELSSLRRELRGSELTLSFYIGRRDRLLRVDLNATLRVGGERIRFDARLDLGDSAMDTWRLEFTFDDMMIEIIWEYREAGARHVHTLDMFMEDRWNTDNIIFTSDWNPTSGAFFFEYEERNRWGNHSDEILRGNFTTQRDNFRLEIDHFQDFGWSRSELALIIRTESGASFANPSFINIDQWDQRLMNRVEDLLWDIGW
jgi:hypothetical protein